MTSTITVENLKTILEILIRRLNKENRKEFAFDEDLYWDIDIEEMIRIDKDPLLEVGSLNDDIDFLNSLLIEDYETDYLELERLASLFKFMGRQLR
jgi:hypothetical protein